MNVGTTRRNASLAAAVSPVSQASTNIRTNKYQAILCLVQLLRYDQQLLIQLLAGAQPDLHDLDALHTGQADHALRQLQDLDWLSHI